MKIRPEILIIAGGAVLAGILLTGRNASALGGQIGAGAVDMVDGVIAGAVVAVGERVGIPQTDAERGAAELAAGDYWNASFQLPAGDFIAGTWRRLFN